MKTKKKVANGGKILRHLVCILTDGVKCIFHEQNKHNL